MRRTIPSVASAWNADHPVGTPVRIWPLGRGWNSRLCIDTATAKPAKMHAGAAYVLTTGWREPVRLDFVEVRAASETPSYAAHDRNRMQPRIGDLKRHGAAMSLITPSPARIPVYAICTPVARFDGASPSSCAECGCECYYRRPLPGRLRTLCLVCGHNANLRMREAGRAYVEDYVGDPATHCVVSVVLSSTNDSPGGANANDY